jgi:hypothetical protein
MLGQLIELKNRERALAGHVERTNADVRSLPTITT